MESSELLREIGLTDGEIKVYIALLEIGSSSTGNIIKKSKVHASKVYHILERLIDKGLVAFIKKGKRTIYTANPPITLMSYLTKRESEISDLKESAQKLIKELSKKTLTSTIEATVYLGLKGLRTASEKMYLKVKKGDILYYLGIPAFQPEEQHIYWEKEHVKRSEHGIKVKLLFNKDTNPEILSNRNSYKGSDARFMPTDIKTPALFGMYKDVVLIMLQSPQLITIEIINKHIAESFKAYFEEFWKRSVSFKKKNNNVEEARQEAKEKAILLALQKNMALIRRGLKIFRMKKDGSTVLISESKDYDSLWNDALEKLKSL